MQVWQLMQSKVESVHTHDAVERARRLLRTHCSIPVIDADTRVVGILTADALVGSQPQQRAETAMSTRVSTVRHTQPVADAYEILLRRRFDRIPVVDDMERLIGSISLRDVVTARTLRPIGLMREVVAVVDEGSRLRRTGRSLSDDGYRALLYSSLETLLSGFPQVASATSVLVVADRESMMSAAELVRALRDACACPPAVLLSSRPHECRDGIVAVLRPDDHGKLRRVVAHIVARRHVVARELAARARSEWGHGSTEH